MITCKEAAEITLKHCKEYKYIEDIRENEDYYFVSGNDGYEGVAYGDGYYVISKSDGNIEFADMCSMIGTIMEAKSISIPQEYKKK